MPGRFEPFINNRIYHIFNKTIEAKKIFIDHNNCDHFLELVKYYRSAKARISFSKLKLLKDELRREIIKATLPKKYFQIELLSYCLMPTHFHFLIRQKNTDGVKIFVSNVLNAFTRYFNIKTERKGPIFLTQFKSVGIQRDEQLIHVSRYIHLNPYSSQLVKSFGNLEKYSWVSYKEYINTDKDKDKICDTKTVLGYFNGDRGKYQKFVEDNADYQKSLEYVKHVAKW